VRATVRSDDLAQVAHAIFEEGEDLMHGRFVIGAALIGVAVAVPMAGQASSSGGSSKVALREWAIAPVPASATAGKITFIVKNNGKAKHEFVVIRTNLAPGKLPIKKNRASEKGAKGEVGNLLPGATKRLTLTLPKGKYVLICNYIGHYQAGQRAAFTVR
jgi:uncharacterized cupredoxin-like copper-binding protein